MDPEVVYEIVGAIRARLLRAPQRGFINEVLFSPLTLGTVPMPLMQGPGASRYLFPNHSA
jgi:hypothetical protein